MFSSTNTTFSHFTWKTTHLDIFWSQLSAEILRGRHHDGLVVRLLNQPHYFYLSALQINFSKKPEEPDLCHRFLDRINEKVCRGNLHRAWNTGSLHMTLYLNTPCLEVTELFYVTDNPKHKLWPKRKKRWLWLHFP